MAAKWKIQGLVLRTFFCPALLTMLLILLRSETVLQFWKRLWTLMVLCYSSTVKHLLCMVVQFPPPAAGDSHPRWWSEQRLTLPAGYPVQDTPPDVKHGGMVINMEEGDLATFLPQYEEDSVHEFNYFGKIIPPQHLGYLCEQEQSSRRSIPVHNRA